jgi:hypothetical protein
VEWERKVGKEAEYQARGRREVGASMGPGAYQAPLLGRETARIGEFQQFPAPTPYGTIYRYWRFRMSTAKEEIARLVQAQPEGSSREEIVRELAFHVMVERGLADSDERRVVSNDEMSHRIRTWRR